MSSKPRDQGTMTAASSGAQASDAALAKQADQSTAYAKQAHDLLFGAGTGTGSGTGAVTGGTLSKFLDPNSLNVSEPTGAYGLQYNKTTENIANQGTQNRGAIARGFASRGFGNMPAGFVADQSRQELADESNQKGAAFTDLAGKSYADALNNFWNASNIASGSGAANTNAAISADSAAANNYANLYGTASTPKPSLLPTLVGGGLQAGGQIGAAVACTCKGSMILQMDGTEKPIEDCKKGDLWQGIDGEPCELLEEPTAIEAECVRLSTGENCIWISVNPTILSGDGTRYSAKVSKTHTPVLACGGYEYAEYCADKLVAVGKSLSAPNQVMTAAKVESVENIGINTVYSVKIGGSHSYRVDGFWSLS